MVIRQFVQRFIRRVKDIYTTIKSKTLAIWGRSRQYFFLILNGAMLIYLIEYIGLAKGLIVFAGFYALLAVFIIIRKWDSFLNIMKWGETKIWGRPLDKEFWPEGFENRPKRKVKIVWKKKDKRDKDEKD